MANYGRIQAVVIATLTGNVVYERFYESFADQEKADLRSALQQVTETRLSTAHGRGLPCFP